MKPTVTLEQFGVIIEYTSDIPALRSRTVNHRLLMALAIVPGAELQPVRFDICPVGAPYCLPTFNADEFSVSIA